MAEFEKKEANEAQDADHADVQLALDRPEALAILAHELRTPLAPIRNGAELLRTLCTDPRQTQIVDMMSRQIVHLTRLLDDVLEAARLRRGIVQLNRCSIDMGRIVQDALDGIAASVDARRQHLLVSLPATPVQMSCDPTRLVQVLHNLLDNASRFTPDGGTLSLAANIESDELIIEVSDTGQGIDSSLLPRLFNVFTQGEQPLHRPQGGLGVGLVIARHIVELHGGTIAAFSHGPGLGSQFVIRLPIELVAPAPKQSPSEPMNVKGLRALVVDDNMLIATSLAQYLEEQRGYAVSVAYSGEAALEAVGDIAPHVAVVDIGLPGIDGFELARRLRARFASIVLIAVSGYSWDMLEGVQADLFATYLAKPASPQTIADTIELIMRGASSKPAL